VGFKDFTSNFPDSVDLQQIHKVAVMHAVPVFTIKAQVGGSTNNLYSFNLGFKSFCRTCLIDMGEELFRCDIDKLSFQVALNTHD